MKTKLTYEQRMFLLDMSGYEKYQKDITLFTNNSINDKLFIFNKNKLDNFIKDFNNMQNKNPLFILKTKMIRPNSAAELLMLHLVLTFYQKNNYQYCTMHYVFRNKLRKMLKEKSPEIYNLVKKERRNKNLGMYRHVCLLYTELAVNVYGFISKKEGEKEC